MQKLPFAIKEIRTNLEEMQGKPIKVKANMGRSKVFEREGVVHQIHPSLFVVETLEKRERTARATYQFSDVLTGSVELSHPETGEMVFPWLVKDD
jgi:uncharacterized protein Veg